MACAQLYDVRRAPYGKRTAPRVAFRNHTRNRALTFPRSASPPGRRPNGTDPCTTPCVELEVDPVDGEIAALLLSSPDEVAAQPGPSGLRRHGLALEDLQIVADPGGLSLPLQQVVQTTTPVDVVICEVYLRDPGMRHRHVVLGPVPLDELVLHHPVDFGTDPVEVLGLDRVERAAPQFEHLLDRA